MHLEVAGCATANRRGAKIPERALTWLGGA